MANVPGKLATLAVRNRELDAKLQKSRLELWIAKDAVK
jgi:hypothetical protein